MKPQRFARSPRQQQQRQRATQYEIEATAGWSRPFDGATWHYFKRGSVRSACGNVLYSGSPRDDANDSRQGACRTCQEQVQALRKAVRP